MAAGGDIVSKAGELYALAERCEQATGDDATALVYLEMDICSALAIEPEGHERPFVSSLDAAMSLVPEGCIVMVTNTGVDDRDADFAHCSAIVGQPTDTATDYTTAASMPLALCAAALKCLAAQEAGNG